MSDISLKCGVIDSYTPPPPTPLISTNKDKDKDKAQVKDKDKESELPANLQLVCFATIIVIVLIEVRLSLFVCFLNTIVVQFCFPLGFHLQQQPETSKKSHALPPKFHGITLTQLDGSRLYVACLTGTNNCRFYVTCN